MSRKTMDEFNDLRNVYPRPKTWPQQNVDTRDISQLNPETAAPLFHQPWQSDGHLASAGDDLCDAIWNISEGKRDVRQWKK